MNNQALTHMLMNIFTMYSLLVSKRNISSDPKDHPTKFFRTPISIYFVQHQKKCLVSTKVGVFSLTMRQLECLQCLVNGLSAKQSGRELHLSHRTVEAYILQIKNIMNCRSRYEIIKNLL